MMADRPALTVPELERKARWVRRVALERAVAAGRGHLGGVYSCAELLVAFYYGGVLRVDPARPSWPARDRFFLGKGHACLGLYPILQDLGLLDSARFDSYGRDGGLGGQLDITIPGVEYNTGSLGHVLGIAAGVALAAKLDGASFQAFALLGDAECYEGAIWEALVFAGQQRLDRLVGIIDRNRLSVTDVLDDEGFFKGLPDAVRGFGWDCYELDGHAFPELLRAFEAARAASRPSLIIANTIKGKGVSFMEHGIHWHHAVPKAQELELARRELGDDDARR